MTENINPSRAPQPHPKVERDAIHTVVDGLGIVRKPLFAAPTSQEGWQKQMLTHINAAKTLGFTMFEIDTVESYAPQRKKKEEAPRGGMFFSVWDISSIQKPVEGDEWKQPTEEAPQDGERMVKTTFVRVYALAVE